MEKISDEMRTKNECEKGEYEGNIHRWQFLDMPKLWWPETIHVSQGDTDSPETFLPSAYCSVRFVCTECGAVIWEEAIFEIGGGQIMPYKIIEGKRVES